MFESLIQRGLRVERQLPITITYNEIKIDNAFRADLVLEGLVLIELKSVEKHSAVHAKQILTYLRLAGFPLGLLMSFGMATFKEGIHRFGNGYFIPPQQR